MKLAILDIDGTLTATSEIDARCFARALEDCFALTGIETDWSTYKYATDAGIFAEVFQRHFQRSPLAAETARMLHSFVAHLQRGFERDASAFAAVEGAGRFLSHLEQEADWACVVATGGWGVSARLKLRAADLTIPCPVVSCDDGVSREEILREAMAASLRFHGVEGFSRIVSVGDGVWDVKTARSLGLPFVGIARGAGAERLRSCGASHILPDFRDIDEVFTALNKAEEPSLEFV